MKRVLLLDEDGVVLGVDLLEQAVLAHEERTSAAHELGDDSSPRPPKGLPLRRTAAPSSDSLALVCGADPEDQEEQAHEHARGREDVVDAADAHHRDEEEARAERAEDAARGREPGKPSGEVPEFSFRSSSSRTQYGQTAASVAAGRQASASADNSAA